MPTPSINRIQIIGTVYQAPTKKQTKHAEYLEVLIKTVDSYVHNSVQKQEIEIHEVRVFGQQARFLDDMITTGDTVYCEGALKSFDRKFYISSKLARIIAKSNEAQTQASNVYPKRKI